MCSKNFVPRALTSALFFTFLVISTIAQAPQHLVGDAWKASGKSTSEAKDSSDKQVPANPAATPTQSNSKEQVKALSSSWASTTPIEPNIQPANPPLQLEAEVAVVKSSKLATLDRSESEIVGIEPPRSFQATAYSLRGITRSGSYVRRGVIAADPRVLPLGSVVHLKAGNYTGVYSVQDTGGAIKGKRIDVWMPSSREARSFGRQNVRLTVLKYGGKHKVKGK